MPKLELNSALKSISGGIDAWVYRSVRGRTFICRRPTRSSAPSDAQLAVRERFRLAADYARAGATDPALQAAFGPLAKERGVSLFTVLMGDYLSSPTVNAIDLSGYHGQVGELIKMRASDDVGVTKVSVALHAADGALLEGGEAVLQFGTWVYAATTQRVPGTPVTITATAGDRPGNVGSKSETWV